MKLYQYLAQLVQARSNTNHVAGQAMFHLHEEKIEELVKEYMPSGGGFDAGTHIDFLKSTGEKLVFKTSFHHMDKQGGYDGWTEHAVTARPSLLHGFTLHISGKDRNDTKGYIGETFFLALERAVD